MKLFIIAFKWAIVFERQVGGVARANTTHTQVGGRMAVDNGPEVAAEVGVRSGPGLSTLPSDPLRVALGNVRRADVDACSSLSTCYRLSSVALCSV